MVVFLGYSLLSARRMEERTRIDSTQAPPMMDKLIDENRSLRETIELLTYCREISSHLDYEPIAQTALRIMAGTSGAKSGFVVWKRIGDKVWRVLAAHGVRKEEGKKVAEHLEKWVLGSPKHLSGVRWIDGGGLAIPIRLEDRQNAIIVLQFPPELVVSRDLIEQLKLIANQAALSLNNAFRFEQARDLAFIDDLTGLYNTRFLDTYLDKELKRAIRQKYPISFLFLDLDDFKQINDQHGHLTGSRILIEVGRELRNVVRDSDVIVRYGGDEYVMILINTPMKGAREVAERTRDCIANRPFLKELDIDPKDDRRITASVGVATFPTHAKDKTTVLKLADHAMYIAKAKSKNSVHVIET